MSPEERAYLQDTQRAVEVGEPLPSFTEPGDKDDSAKVNQYRGTTEQFPRALRQVAIITQGGAKKYSWGGWAHVSDGINRYRDAEARLKSEEAKGEVFDPDHSRSCVEPVQHLGQRIWNLLAVLELTLRDEEESPQLTRADLKELTEEELPEDHDEYAAVRGAE